MSKKLFVTATEARSGKSAVFLGLMQLLMRDVQKVAFFRPIINAKRSGARDHDIDLILSHYNLEQDYSECYAYTIDEAKQLISQGQQSLMLENILKRFKELEDEYDFILCGGTDFDGDDSAVEFDLNAEVAANLGCPVLVVAKALDRSCDEVTNSAQLTMEAFEEKGLETIGVIANRQRGAVPEDLAASIRKASGRADLPVYSIPEDMNLSRPTLDEVRRWLDAEVLYGDDVLLDRVDDYLVSAMHIANFLDYIEENHLIITPGDRSDIILASLGSRMSATYPNVSGIVLTGGLRPNDNLSRLIEGWSNVPLGVLLTKGNTSQTIEMLNNCFGRIEANNPRKINTALGLFEKCVNTEELRQALVSTRSNIMTPKMFEFSLIEKAKADKVHIVLPEGDTDRIVQAADIILRRDVCDLTLLGKHDKIESIAQRLSLNVEGARIVDIENSEYLTEYSNAYYEMRKHKGMNLDNARDAMLDINHFGTMMVNLGHADGMVSGSTSTTANVLSPAFKIIKTKPGASIVSSVFLMCLKDRVLVFGDCAVNPNPNAEQLAEIATSSAETARIFGVVPRVAMLSYSTGESGKGADVDIVKEAVKIAQVKAPELLLEGPLQYDAAIDANVAKTKLPDSRVAGKATVFIFPDLNTGNNTYKAVQRAAGALAIGPVLQGLRKPVNDLSRGCTVDDIVNTVAITAIQAQAEKGK